jgi:NAD(P)-dependent dehydrogenase (short-subunit alcohol dehydrogenase family)
MAYSASKAAVIGMTKVQGKEVAGTGKLAQLGYNILKLGAPGTHCEALWLWEQESLARVLALICRNSAP